MDFYKLRETCLKSSGKASWQREGGGDAGDMKEGEHIHMRGAEINKAPPVCLCTHNAGVCGR